MPRRLEDPQTGGSLFGSRNDEDMHLAARIAEPVAAAPTQDEWTTDATKDSIRFQLQTLNAKLLHENEALLAENAALKNIALKNAAPQQHAESSQNSLPAKKDDNLKNTVAEQRGDDTQDYALDTELRDNSTTIIVRLLRSIDGTPEMIMNDLDTLGFAFQYDYIYVPRTRKSTKGYAFVNMTEPVHAQRFSDCIAMLKDPRMQQLELEWLDNASSADYARVQGRDENLRQCWSICKGLWPVHDNLPYVRVDGTMKPVLPWEHLDEQPPEDNKCTPQTLCLRGIPHRVCPVEMMTILDGNGFEGRYSYFFMPCDVRTYNHRGYAFIHLDSQEFSRLFIDRMNGYSFENHSGKQLRVGLAMQQGIAESLARNKTLQYSGSLLLYPWVRVNGEMTCVSNDEAVRICLQNLKGDKCGESTDSVGSTEGVSSASTAMDD
jgi:RNA recognition motif-containing protein